jgi:hypothetical protein
VFDDLCGTAGGTRRNAGRGHTQWGAGGHDESSEDSENVLTVVSVLMSHAARNVYGGPGPKRRLAAKLVENLCIRAGGHNCVDRAGMRMPVNEGTRREREINGVKLCRAVDELREVGGPMRQLVGRDTGSILSQGFLHKD